MPVFKRQIDQKILKSLKGPKTQRVCNRKSDQLVDMAKDMLDEDIDADLTSRKVEGDPETIGFLGLKSDDAPVDELKEVIKNRIDITGSPKKKKSGSNSFRYTYNVKFPSSREIYSEGVLALPWMSKTWVEAIEKGLSNVESFAFRPGRGRSEFGFQLKNGGTARNRATPHTDDNYINRIRTYFKDNLQEAGLKL